jgi:hypothetical protein
MAVAPTLDVAAARLARLLTGGAPGLTDANGDGSLLTFEPSVAPQPLARLAPPPEAWAVDGGMATVADARCVQLVVTRAASVRYRDGRCDREHEGELAAHVLGIGETRTAVDALGLGVAPDAGLEGAAHLLRDGAEWRAVADVVSQAVPGALVLVDGDLQPDWRIPSSFLATLLRDAAQRGVIVIGVTKHSSLARGGAPLLGQLELEATRDLGERSLWWAPIARTRDDLVASGAAALRVVAARLDPDAPFAFRIDVPADVDPATVLGQLSALADDAAFPGYPYPLSVADRLAACPGWLRQEVRTELDELFDQHGVAWEVRERAFADRHRMMERY